MRVPVSLSAALLTWSVIANLLIGDRFYTVRNLVLTALLLLLAHRLLTHGPLAEPVPAVRPGEDPHPRRSRAAWTELGLHPRSLGSGVWWGSFAVIIIALTVAAGLLLEGVVPGVSALLADDRAEVAPWRVAQITLLRIPLGTALFEEVAFRGVLLALFTRLLQQRWSLAWSSVVFGLWHIAPTIVTLRLNDVAPSSTEGLFAVIAAVLLTMVAGGVLGWLRLISRSLVAPVLAHWAINGIGLLAASDTTATAWARTLASGG